MTKISGIDDKILAHAYVDGELDAAGAMAFEQRLGVDATLAAYCSNLSALSLAVRVAAPMERATPELLRRIAPVPASVRQQSWKEMAIAACITAILASAVTSLVLQQNRPDETLASLISAHMRGLASPQGIDVVSSDHHTIKPWFDGRLTFSPQVVDLASEGFSLTGGRLDVVSGQMAATMVYRYQNHTLTLTQARTASLPAGFGGSIVQGERSRDGFTVLTFAAADLTCWLVTDLPPPQSRAFVESWQKQRS